MNLTQNLNATNSSSETQGGGIQGTRVNLKPAFGVIAILAMLMNGMLCHVMMKNKTQVFRIPYNVLIFSLAIIDSITGFLIFITPRYVFGDLFPVPHHQIGRVFCYFVTSEFSIFASASTSVFHVTALTIERWFAMVKPVTYRENFSRKRTGILLLVIWFTGFLIKSYQLFEMRYEDMPAPLNPLCKNVGNAITRGDMRQYFSLFEFLLKFGIPLFISFISISHIYIKVKSSPSHFQTSRRKMGLRLVSMCLLTIVLFTICWLPNQIYFLMFKFDLVKLGTFPHQVTVLLCSSNSCINPFLYIICNKSYRQMFKNFLSCRSGNQIHSAQFESQTQNPRRYYEQDSTGHEMQGKSTRQPVPL